MTFLRNLFPRRTTPFEAALKYREKHATISSDGQDITVHGNLDLRNIPVEVFELPRSLHIQGSLFIAGTKVVRLPDHLTVDGSFHLEAMRLTVLPGTLTIGMSLSMNNTLIAELPENLSMQGDLSASACALTRLPKGLRVGGRLDIQDTPITHLPPDMHVGKMRPTTALRDIQAFMDTTSDAVLHSKGSYHARMEQRVRLQNFPDLLQVLNLLDGDRLHLWKNAQGRVLSDILHDRK